MGYKCAAATGPYFANSVTQTGSDPEDQSKCIWIDGDDTNGITTQGFSLHIVDFGRTDGAVTNGGGQTTNPVAEQWNNNTDLLCKAPGRMNFYNAFGPDDFPIIYQPPLEYNPDGTDQDPNAVLHTGCDDDPELIVSPCGGSDYRKSKRNAQATRQARGLNSSTPMASTLVHSNSSAHSAEESCSHPGYIGPSLVSYHEGTFCDMATRIVWPLCSDTVPSGCFDPNANKLVLDQKGLNSTHIDLLNPSGNGNFTHIVHW